MGFNLGFKGLTAKTLFVRLTRQLIRFVQPTSIIPSYSCIAFFTARNCTTGLYSLQFESNQHCHILVFNFFLVCCGAATQRGSWPPQS